MIALKKIREIILSPSGYLEEIRDQPLKDDILSFVLVTVAGSILMFFSTVITTAVNGRGELLGPAGIVVMILTILFLFVVDGLFLMLIVSLIEHCFVLFTGEHRGFEKTMKSVIYASVLPVLFFWIPSVFHITCSALLLVVAFGIITFYSILTFHEKTKDRAAFVAIFTMGFILILLWFGKVNIIGNAW
ncbi:YIP1 family protein [Methanoregula sp.]|uniref:YIP1 family protein n=1 Tax=Methanoregula sp. TaxID=2052170 RepID=UPI003C71E96C